LGNHPPPPERKPKLAKNGFFLFRHPLGKKVQDSKRWEVGVFLFEKRGWKKRFLGCLVGLQPKVLFWGVEVPLFLGLFFCFPIGFLLCLGLVVGLFWVCLFVFVFVFNVFV